jgi:FkbM family methyltransferase
MSYSQNDEEDVISRLLGSGSSRKFLDIGAHDGVTFSNTRRLADEGWGATLVEPSPSAFIALMKNYEGRANINLVHAAVVESGPQRLLKFYDSRGDMISTLDEKHRGMWGGRPGHVQALGAAARPIVGFQPIYVAALSVADLIAQFPGPYDFLNLDVEGTNFELFRALPLRSVGVSVACVEYQDKKKEITQLAVGQGYEVAHTTSENLILRRVL